MIIGFERFKEFFQDYDSHYVLIGGVATMQWLTDAGMQPRATKDFDIVLIVEALNDEFLKRFWQFIKNGRYENIQGDEGKRVYYRFKKPKATGFPEMLEVFSRTPDGLVMDGAPEIVPIPAGDDASSLSAILMDTEYYSLVSQNRRSQNGLSLLAPAGLILLKAKAWLDLSERDSNGDHVDEKNIKKHRNDVFRLALLLAPEDKISVPSAIHADLSAFLDAFPQESPIWSDILKSIKSSSSPSNLITVLRDNYSANAS